MPIKKPHPDRVRLIDALRRLPAKEQALFAMDVLGELGASGIVIAGANGELESQTFDRTLAPKYLKNRAWSPDLLHLIATVLAGGGSFVDIARISAP